MKIRNGFVTNSSSTNYLILSKEELSAEKLAFLLGVKINSPIYSMVVSLCDSLLQKGDLRPGDDLYNVPLEKQVLNIFGKETLKKFNKLTSKGYVSYYGTVSDNYDDIEALLALDSFKEDNKEIFMDFSDGMY